MEGSSGHIPQQKADPVAWWLVCGMLVSVTFLQKIYIPFGDTPVFFSLFMIAGLSGLGFLTGRLELRKVNLTAYCGMVGVIAMTQLFGGNDFSFLSLLLFITIHVFYIFGMKPGMLPDNFSLLFYQKFMLIFAGLSVLQYISQFVVGADLAFPLDTFLPELVIPGYNAMNALDRSAGIYKSTAFFMIEPSVLCQFLAIAVIIEMVYFKNLLRLGAYLCGIAMTFSGTGLIPLILLAPVYLLLEKRYFILMGMLIVAVTVPMWAPMIGLERTLDRVNEFTNPHSSAYARFISIFPTLENMVMDSPRHVLFGLGASTSGTFMGTNPYDYQVHFPGWGKVIYEYGLVGLLAYFSFIFLIFKRGASSNYLKVACVIQMFFLGEFVLTPLAHALILVLINWPLKESHKIPLKNEIKEGATA